jgi:ribosomal protein S18 acetylase RimI-like enzyme
MPTFRSATTADIDGVIDLAISHSGGERSRWQTKLLENLDRRERCLLVATHANRILGYGRAHHFEHSENAPPNIAPAGYYLSGLVVDAESRRGGLGHELTRLRVAWAAERSREIWYFTNAANRGSQDLHQRHGFQEVTRDFVFPGVTFSGAGGVLYRARLGNDAAAERFSDPS